MRLNDVFDDFRREIEGAINPWSSMLDWRFPRERPYAMEEEGILSRTPLLDMVDKGDRYHLRMEIPGIDKDKIFRSMFQRSPQAGLLEEVEG
jgi:HSP20 family molecular chaperone IbpA